MQRCFASMVVLTGLLLTTSCGDDGRPSGQAGNDSTLVGGPCMNGSDCDFGLCQDGDQFPGGVCTLSCGGSGNCPSGSSCGELEAGFICLVNCTQTADCRTDWLCESVIEAGTRQTRTVSVCIGPEPT